ncbi:Conserved_hypothetical protein [Hexamita inflata]|uniref:Uncharacterized protein n=1 Tax=Hexamita inflata TaxID=28002 RepID=A0AA86PHL0_9EUKA|nr:Conserved hypothetical protein [Hexamita inflata]
MKPPRTISRTLSPIHKANRIAEIITIEQDIPVQSKRAASPFFDQEELKTQNLAEQRVFSKRAVTREWVEAGEDFEKTLDGYNLNNTKNRIVKDTVTEQSIHQLCVTLQSRVVTEFDPLQNENESYVTIEELDNRAMSDIELYLYIYDQLNNILEKDNANVSHALMQLKSFFVQKIMKKSTQAKAYEQATVALDKRCNMIEQQNNALLDKIKQLEDQIEYQNDKLARSDKMFLEAANEIESKTNQLYNLRRDVESKNTQIKMVTKDFQHQQQQLEDAVVRCKRLTQAAFRVKQQLDRATERYTTAERIATNAVQNQQNFDRQLDQLRENCLKYKQEAQLSQKLLEEQNQFFMLERTRLQTQLLELKNDETKFTINIENEGLNSAAKNVIGCLKKLSMAESQYLAGLGLSIKEIGHLSYFINNVGKNETTDAFVNFLTQTQITMNQSKATQTIYYEAVRPSPFPSIYMKQRPELGQGLDSLSGILGKQSQEEIDNGSLNTVKPLQEKPKDQYESIFLKQKQQQMAKAKQKQHETEAQQQHNQQKDSNSKTQNDEKSLSRSNSQAVDKFDNTDKSKSKTANFFNSPLVYKELERDNNTNSSKSDLRMNNKRDLMTRDPIVKRSDSKVSMSSSPDPKAYVNVQQELQKIYKQQEELKRAMIKKDEQEQEALDKNVVSKSVKHRAVKFKQIVNEDEEKMKQLKEQEQQMRQYLEQLKAERENNEKSKSKKHKKHGETRKKSAHYSPQQETKLISQDSQLLLIKDQDRSTHRSSSKDKTEKSESANIFAGLRAESTDQSQDRPQVGLPEYNWKLQKAGSQRSSTINRNSQSKTDTEQRKQQKELSVNQEESIELLRQNSQVIAPNHKAEIRKESAQYVKQTTNEKQSSIVNEQQKQHIVQNFSQKTVTLERLENLESKQFSLSLVQNLTEEIPLELSRRSSKKQQLIQESSSESVENIQIRSTDKLMDINIHKKSVSSSNQKQIEQNKSKSRLQSAKSKSSIKLQHSDYSY